MNATRDFVDWTSEKQCLQAVKALQRHDFTASYFSHAREAADYILTEARTAKRIGIGGSRSVADLNIVQPLMQMGKEVLVSKGPGVTPEKGMEIRRRQLTCDLFLCSANAVTLCGWLVNIDNTGNRVAAMMFGPGKVILVVGRNKIVDGGLEDAIHRVKERAAPPNAKRLKYKTPCARTGICSDCSAPQRICRVISVMERKPARTDVRVLMVNEDLGY